nr:MAG TPA: hypothetical protein [Ackermannviridae sp.]
MKIYIKRNKKLCECNLYTKRDIMEVTNNGGVSASLNQTVKNPSDAVNNANKILSQNQNVNDVTFQPGQVDGQKSDNTGEGQQIVVDVSDKANAVKKITDATKNPNMKDANIVAYNGKNAQVNTVVTPKGSRPNTGSLQLASKQRNEKLVEMRKNAIPLTKRELNTLLRSL